MRLEKTTPLIVVKDVEPCLPFWTEKLGFEVTVTVPHEDRLGFAILRKGDLELMYQSRASVDGDLGASGAPKTLGKELASSTTTLFIEVDRLDDVLAVLGDTPVVVPRRQTFYSMDEIFVRPPCGTLVGFAARVS
jgi:uncharacterized glyoxalase superfamily protein PhnB